MFELKGPKDKVTDRILLITEFYYPTIGGSITVYDNIYRQYSPGTVWVFTQKIKNVPRHEMMKGIDIRRITFPLYFHSKVGMLVRYLRVLWAVLWLVKREKIQEIHCDQVIPAGVLGWFAHRLLKIPYFIYAHGEEIGIGQKFPFRKKWMKRFYEEANGIFSNSRFTASLVHNLGVPEEKIGVLYWGVSKQLLSFKNDMERLRTKYGMLGKKVILTVSRITLRKGHSLVLKALRDLVPAHPDWHYLIVGEGEEKNYLMELVKDYSLEDRTTFLGQLSDEELWEVYLICDLFVMPNFELENGEMEGFGLVFLEAGAFGKPVIGGNSGGTPEAILDGKTGYVITPKNVDELKNKMTELLSQPNLGKRMGEEARKRILDYFVWEKVFSRLENFRQKRLG